MKWRKLGKIFEPKGSQLWMTTHATVPFAEHMNDDVFRIYFSCRDNANRSHVGFVELDINEPQEILTISESPILSPGALGTFDDSGTVLFQIVHHKSRRYLYYSGWSLGVTIPFYFYIGLAASDAGTDDFVKISEAPILERNAVDPYLTGAPAILIEDDKWKMWYISGVRWVMENSKPKHYYHVRYADSSDGIDWRRSGKVCIDFKDETEFAIARPFVIKEQAVYKMWYSYRGDFYRIGYAESKDGLDWVRQDDQSGIDVSPSGWDSEMICYPHVFDHRGKRYMVYNGNGYGKTGFGLAVLES